MRTWPAGSAMTGGRARRSGAGQRMAALLKTENMSMEVGMSARQHAREAVNARETGTHAVTGAA
jgi:hypothetical protein